MKWMSVLVGAATLLGGCDRDRSSLTGTWSFESGTARLILQQDGDSLSGRFESGDGSQYWIVRGTVDGDGEVELVRYIPLTEWTHVPEPALSQAKQRYPTDIEGLLPSPARLTHDPDADRLSGYYVRLNAKWRSGSGELVEVEEVREDIALTRRMPVPFSASETRERFEALESELVDLIEGASATAEDPALLPENQLHAARHRLGLVRRYLRMDGIHASATPVEHPGVPSPRQTPVRPLEYEELFLLAVVYGQLLLDPPPRDEGSFSTRLPWNDRHGRRIYFSTQREEAQLAQALTYRSIEELRGRLRKYLSALAEGTVGATFLIPGASLSYDAYVLVTGRNLGGQEATFAEKLLAVADIGLQTAPITIGVLRSSAISRSRVRHPLEAEVTDLNALRARLGATRNPVTREMIMTQWLDDYNALMGFRGRPITTRTAPTVTAAGDPYPQAGIDSYVVPRTGGASARGVVREFKRLREFDGNWESASRAGLSDARVRIPGVHTSQSGARQGSWSWVVDRAIKARDHALRNNLPDEAAAATDLLRRFRDGRLSRQVMVMTDDGAIFVSREAQLLRICEEAVNPGTGAALTLPELRAAVGTYLSGP